MKTWILFAVVLPLTAHACIWDAETLSHEKSRSHDLATIILGQEKSPADETNQLQARISDLEANRKETDPDWWNNLAGAYIRLGQSQKAVDLLEPVVKKFPDNYGIHANLGTAYHLLGRYADAEKEIARDLEINPDAHFGLEKYHLALLQYLVRDAHYQSRHVYVDEFTPGFLVAAHGGRAFFRSYRQLFELSRGDTNNAAMDEVDYESLVRSNANESVLIQALISMAAADPPPAYQSKWDLMSDTNFEAGIIYMAEMNPREPACWTMLGIAASDRRAYHLAIKAYQHSIALDSPQSDLLQRKIKDLNDFIWETYRNDPRIWLSFVFALIGLTIAYYIYTKIRDRRRDRPATA